MPCCAFHFYHWSAQSEYPNMAWATEIRVRSRVVIFLAGTRFDKPRRGLPRHRRRALRKRRVNPRSLTQSHSTLPEGF